MGVTKAKPLRTTCEYEPCSGPMPTTGRYRRFCSKACGDNAWRDANRERYNETLREWAAANPERSRAIKHRHAVANRDAFNARAREVGAVGGYRERHAQRVAELGADVVAEQMRARQLRIRYGITTEQYDAMYEAQDGCCAMCGRPEPAEGRRLAVDHDHRCCPGRKSCGRCLRGLLCTSCNNHLGVLEDDAFVAAADAYRANPPAHAVLLPVDRALA